MATKAEAEQAQAVVDIIRAMMPTFEVTAQGLKLTDTDGKVAMIPITQQQVVLNTRKIM